MMAQILAQLLAVCSTLPGLNMVEEFECKRSMVRCVQEKYSRQYDNISDLCLKEYLKEIK